MSAALSLIAERIGDLDACFGAGGRCAIGSVKKVNEAADDNDGGQAKAEKIANRARAALASPSDA